MLGAAPHPHSRREREVDYPGSKAKSHSSPLQPSADATPSLNGAASRAYFHFMLSRAAALDAASSGAAAASQCCSSPKQHLFVAARRHRRWLARAVQQHAKRQLKAVCGLHQVRFLCMLIPARALRTSAWQKELFRCATSTPLRLTACPAAFALHTAHL